MWLLCRVFLSVSGKQKKYVKLQKFFTPTTSFLPPFSTIKVNALLYQENANISGISLTAQSKFIDERHSMESKSPDLRSFLNINIF